MSPWFDVVLSAIEGFAMVLIAFVVVFGTGAGVYLLLRHFGLIAP